MRLNQNQRAAMARAALIKVLRERYDELKQTIVGEVSRIYKVTFSEELKLAERLPKGWVNTAQSCQVLIINEEGRGENLHRQHSEHFEPEARNRRVHELQLDKTYFCNSRYGRPHVPIQKGSDNHNALKTLWKEQRDLIKEIDRFYSETRAVLASCRTHKQLQETAPELYKLLPAELVQQPGQAVVPIETVETVREYLRASQ